MLAIHFSLERLYSFTLNHWEATNTSYISGQCGFDCVITVDVRCPGNQTLYFSCCCPTGVGVLGDSTVANLIAYTDLYYYSIYSPHMETSTQHSPSYHFIWSNTHTHTQLMLNNNGSRWNRIHGCWYPAFRQWLLPLTQKELSSFLPAGWKPWELISPLSPSTHLMKSGQLPKQWQMHSINIRAWH